MADNLVKQDINFLEYPIWVQDKHLAEKADGYVWQDREGYIYRAGYKPPVKTDFVFLLYLLMRSQQNDWQDVVEFTRYEVLTACGMAPSKEKYRRLEESIKRWEMVRLQFQGIFYDGKDYQTINFGIIDSWAVEKETKKLKIRFSPEWLLKIKESNFFKLLDFEQVKALRSPLVLRLYEILIKNFQGRNQWEIDSQKLAQKIPMKEAYPADILPKITAAVNRINTYSTLKINLQIKRRQRGKAILLFEKLPEQPGETRQAPPVELPEAPGFQELIALLPPAHQKQRTILDMLARACRQHGYDYAARNLCYTNQHCTGNYRAYLAKALKHDWGLALAEDEARAKEQKEEAKTQAAAEAQRRQQEEEEKNRIGERFLLAEQYINNLGREELKALQAEARQKMAPHMLQLLKANNKLGRVNLRFTMQAIVIERKIVG